MPESVQNFFRIYLLYINMQMLLFPSICSECTRMHLWRKKGSAFISDQAKRRSIQLSILRTELTEAQHKHAAMTLQVDPVPLSRIKQTEVATWELASGLPHTENMQGYFMSSSNVSLVLVSALRISHFVSLRLDWSLGTSEYRCLAILVIWTLDSSWNGLVWCFTVATCLCLSTVIPTMTITMV